MNHCISLFEDPRDPISDVQTVRYWIHPSNYLNSMTSQWIKVLSSVYSKLCMCNKYDGNGRQGSTNQNSNRSGPSKILDDRSGTDQTRSLIRWPNFGPTSLLIPDGRSEESTRRWRQKLTSALQWVSSNRTSGQLTYEQMFACQQCHFGYVCS